MADIINLRQVRKVKARGERAAEADANRLAFGRTKAEKRETALEKARKDALLDGHRLADGGHEGDGGRD